MSEQTGKKTNLAGTLRAGFRRINASIRTRPWLQFILFGFALILFGLGPYIGFTAGSTVSIMGRIVLYTVVALGLNILLGYSGMVSLATAGFVGAGALGIGVFVVEFGLPFELAALLTLVIGGLLGVVVGLLSLRVSGIYLAIGTLFVGEILRQIYTSVAIFGGEAIRIGSLTFLGSIELDRNMPYTIGGNVFFDRYFLYIILVVVMVIVLILSRNLVKSHTGRALMALSRSENAAQSMGVSLMKYRVTAFVFATILATLGGVLYALYYQDAPTRQWNILLSLMLLAIVVVGGMKSFFGIFLGSFIIYGIPSLFLREYFGDVSYILSGVLIIVVIMFYPKGFIFIGHDLKRQIGRLKRFIKERRARRHDTT